MNLAHFAFLAALCAASVLMVVFIMLFTRETRAGIRLVRFFGCCAVLSLAAIWIGLLCKLVTAIIN